MNGFTLESLGDILVGTLAFVHNSDRVGFPFSYMQDGTYGTHGRFLRIEFLGDLGIAGNNHHSGLVFVA